MRVQLTRRGMAALKLVDDGKANKEIAVALDISERTVKTHLANLSNINGSNVTDGCAV